MRGAPLRKQCESRVTHAVRFCVGCGTKQSQDCIVACELFAYAPVECKTCSMCNLCVLCVRERCIRCDTAMS